jgi:serine-type D-Ala-D-Ala carboxypeptidase
MQAQNVAAPPELAAVLQEGVDAGVFPGAVAAVGQLTEHAPLHLFACAGTLSPAEARVEHTTPYDLASLTKPVVAITALRLAQRGVVDLHEPIARTLGELDGTLGGDRSLALLLSHRAGLAAWAPLFEEISAAPGSLEAKCQLRQAAATRVDATSTPTHSVYSDLGYLLAGEVLAQRAGCSLDQLVRREVSEPLAIVEQLFYPASLAAEQREQLRARVAPTELCARRGGILRGEVHDDNCQAYGGVAGHAGLFGTAEAVLTFGLAVLQALEGRSRWLDQALVRWALTARGPGHVVGWDTKSESGSSAGTLFSSHSFGHLGFTGTSLWCDPTRRLCAVLLSNRVHPTRDNIAIRTFRPRFHDTLIELGLPARR